MRQEQNVAVVVTGRNATSPAGPSDLDDLPTAEQVEAAVATLAMLADRTRLRLLWLLSKGEHDVGTLAHLVDTTPAAASHPTSGRSSF